MSSDIRKQKHHERETEAYKNFLIIAKRIKAIEYDKKWVISPDPSDPLRKYIFERETPWFKLRVILRSKEYHHRWGYGGGNSGYESRYDYKFYIGFQGFFADKAGDITLTSNLEVRPRVTKKLLDCINNKLLPNIYTEIMKHEEQYNKAHNQQKYFDGQIAKLGRKNLKIGSEIMIGPLKLQLNADNIIIQESLIAYDKFVQLAKSQGWIK